MAGVDDTAAVAQATQHLLAQQLSKQLLASALPKDGSAATYADRFAEVLADAIAPAAKASTSAPGSTR